MLKNSVDYIDRVFGFNTFGTVIVILSNITIKM